MPSAVKISVTGTREIERALKELGVRPAGRVVRSALNRAGTVVVRRARELAPTPGDPDDLYATGRLKKAITKRLRRQRRGSSTQSVLVGIEKPASRYAHHAEFGTSRQAAEPYLRPALDETHTEVLRVMTDAMKAGIEREIAKLRTK